MSQRELVLAFLHGKIAEGRNGLMVVSDGHLFSDSYPILHEDENNMWQLNVCSTHRKTITQHQNLIQDILHSESVPYNTYVRNLLTPWDDEEKDDFVVTLDIQPMTFNIRASDECEAECIASQKLWDISKLLVIDKFHVRKKG